MPASKSTTELTIVDIFLFLKYSPLNSATDNENGIQNNNASIEVIIVPAIKGKAPYISFRESHSEEVINPNPNSEKAPRLLLIKPYTMPAVSNIIKHDAMSNMVLNILSLSPSKPPLGEDLTRIFFIVFIFYLSSGISPPWGIRELLITAGRYMSSTV